MSLFNNFNFLYKKINKIKIRKCSIKTPHDPCNKFLNKKENEKEKLQTERIKRQEPGKVQLGFIPEEWFLFFVPKTGYTGFYTLLFTTSTYMISKEIYVFDHDYYNGISMAILITYCIKKMGPKVAVWLDQEIDSYEEQFKKVHKENENMLNNLIKEEQKMQECAEGELLLLEFKRQNVQMQLEAEKRKRQMDVYKEIKRRLDYQVAYGKAINRFLWWNRLDYIFYKTRDDAPPEIKDYVRNMSVTEISDIIKKTVCQK